MRAPGLPQVVRTCCHLHLARPDEPQILGLVEFVFSRQVDLAPRPVLRWNRRLTHNARNINEPDPRDVTGQHGQDFSIRRPGQFAAAVAVPNLIELRDSGTVSRLQTDVVSGPIELWNFLTNRNDSAIRRWYAPEYSIGVAKLAAA